MSEVKGTKALELWCKRLIKDCPDVQIDNMTTSWRNGMAFCALVHHFRPDLIDVSKLKPENIYENNQLAYSIAEKHLGIPSLLDPEDMVENDVPDRLSVLTYLSQFYQRLGHTVNTKSSESEHKVTSSVPTTQIETPFKFGKVALDKCAVCGLPVYLAQRLIVAQKLYHRRCFRCSKCSGHLNPKNFHVIDSTNFSCDACKNEKTVPKFLNNNDQIGMLAFSNDVNSRQIFQTEELVTPKVKPRPQSILEKISMFEKNIEKDNISIEDKVGNISLKDNYNNKYKDVLKSNDVDIKNNKYENQNNETSIEFSLKNKANNHSDIDTENASKLPTPVYKSNKEKFNFLQTQLSDDALDSSIVTCTKEDDSESIRNDESMKNDESIKNDESTKNEESIKNDESTKNEESVKNEDSINTDPLPPDENVTADNTMQEEINITDDNRIAQSNIAANLNENKIENSEPIKVEEEITISVPPRRKKQILADKKSKALNTLIKKEYPDHLNPFSDDETEHDQQESEKISTNPFGSSDDEEEEETNKPPSVPDIQSSTPVRRHIQACNPFWSDGEEPSSDEECDTSSDMHKSSITNSTPNLRARRKPRAPPPPPIPERLDIPSTSMDDVASISSYSSHNSTIQSDQKSFGLSTPKSKKKRAAPTPPDSLSTQSGCGGSMDRGVNTHDAHNTSDVIRRIKGPAPGLPLPERREVKMQMSGEELQVQLDMLETQQLGLERQGVLIEQMIRDKCEGDEGPTAPQEEIEDLVIQLCELVNEKNDLFRKQTELMYIRRQQRLEQEQADIEHEIRVIQSRPAVNRIDADKVREEQLVSRLVEIVRLRDELVQQLDAERRRERQEDLAIATSIATKRASRHSESNSSSIKSGDAITPVKKNKVKDKVKKQLKKAKHTLISKKKDEDKPEKEKKSK